MQVVDLKIALINSRYKSIMITRISLLFSFLKNIIAIISGMLVIRKTITLNIK